MSKKRTVFHEKFKVFRWSHRMTVIPPLECFSLNSAQNGNCDFAFWKPRKNKWLKLNEFWCWPRSGTKMWFISIQLFFSLKRDFFKKLVQKSHNFSEIYKFLKFSLNSLIFYATLFSFFLAENRHNFSSKFWFLAGSQMPHKPTLEIQFLATQNSTNFCQKNSLIRKKWSAIFSIF